jgi:4-hydroxymandelate oxidase
VVVFSVDLLAGSNCATVIRAARLDSRNCVACHDGGAPVPGLRGQLVSTDQPRVPMLSGYPVVLREPDVGTATWDWMKRLQDTTPLPVLFKGIVAKEDSERAVAQGIRGLFCSNHGGHAENSRRGTDVFTALALGATAVGIGRPYIEGLGAFGQEGVEMVLAILRRETELVMAQSGAPTIAQITRAYVVER